METIRASFASFGLWSPTAIPMGSVLEKARKQIEKTPSEFSLIRSCQTLSGVASASDKLSANAPGASAKARRRTAFTVLHSFGLTVLTVTIAKF